MVPDWLQVCLWREFDLHIFMNSLHIVTMSPGILPSYAKQVIWCPTGIRLSQEVHTCTILSKAPLPSSSSCSQWRFTSAISHSDWHITLVFNHQSQLKSIWRILTRTKREDNMDQERRLWEMIYGNHLFFKNCRTVTSCRATIIL